LAALSVTTPLLLSTSVVVPPTPPLSVIAPLRVMLPEPASVRVTGVVVPVTLLMPLETVSVLALALVQVWFAPRSTVTAFAPDPPKKMGPVPDAMEIPPELIVNVLAPEPPWMVVVPVFEITSPPTEKLDPLRSAVFVPVPEKVPVSDAPGTPLGVQLPAVPHAAPTAPCHVVEAACAEPIVITMASDPINADFRHFADRARAQKLVNGSIRLRGIGR